MKLGTLLNTANERQATRADANTLVELAYQTMRRRILDNVWAPGFRALEQELAKLLDMSRTPVREAMMRLSNDGLVEVVPRHGMRVLPLSAIDMAEIYQILGALEATAAELVAQRRPSSKQLAPLDEASRAMDQALKADDLDAWALADERFHRHLIELSGNTLLAAAVYNFWDRAHRARMFTLRLRPKPVNSTREHRELVRALRSGDVALAREQHREHRERNGRVLTQILQHFQLPSL